MEPRREGDRVCLDLDDLGFACDDLMLEALGVEFRPYPWVGRAWPRQLEPPADWTLEQRRRQATLLERAAETERDAVAELEAAAKAV